MSRIVAFICHLGSYAERIWQCRVFSSCPCIVEVNPFYRSDTRHSSKTNDTRRAHADCRYNFLRIRRKFHLYLVWFSVRFASLKIEEVAENASVHSYCWQLHAFDRRPNNTFDGFITRCAPESIHKMP